MVKGSKNDCKGDGSDGGNTAFNNVKTFPSPYVKSFNVELISKAKGKAQLFLMTESGKLEATLAVELPEKTPTRIEMRGKSIPGAKILKVEFPNGETINTKLIEIK